MKQFYLALPFFITTLQALGQSIAGISGESIFDRRDSLTYKTIAIGNQHWMQENVAHYVQGSDCFDHDTTNCKKYGRLYTFEQSKHACPEGWHIPSEKEWNQLLELAGGASLAGGKLKTGGISNFEARTGGIRKKFDFADYKQTSGFWSSTEEKGSVYTIFMYCSKPKIKAGTVKEGDYRLSVRCIKNAN